MPGEPGEQVEVGGGVAVAEQAPFSGAAEQIAPAETPTETKEPDYKSLAETRATELAAANAELDRLRQTDKTQRGAQSAQDRRERVLETKVERLGRSLEVLTARLPKDLLGDAAGAEKEVERVLTEHEGRDRDSFVATTEQQRQTILGALHAQGLSDADVSHEELVDSVALWELGRQRRDADLIERATTSALKAIKRIPAPRAATNGARATETPVPVARRLPNMDTGPAAGASESVQALVVRYGTEYDVLTPAQRKNAEDYMRREGLL